MNVETQKIIEQIHFHPRQLAIVTTTFYPYFLIPSERENVGDLTKDLALQIAVNSLRGDLALHMISKAADKGFQIVIVDALTNEGFFTQIDSRAQVFQEIARGMSIGRQQGFNIASQLPDIKAICWTEPEKISIPADCLPEAALPILLDEADVVIPSRGPKESESWATYPDYQGASEQRANHIFTCLLKSEHLWPSQAEDLDLWFGPRIFANRPEVTQLFFNSYAYDPRPNVELDQVARPDLWANATFLPIIAALRQGLRIVGVDVPYRHPRAQTIQELDNITFRKKREDQLKGINLCAIHFIRYLNQDSRSRISKTN